MGVLKLVTPDVQRKLLLLGEKLGVEVSLLIRHCACGRLYDESTSVFRTHLDVGIFSFY